MNTKTWPYGGMSAVEKFNARFGYNFRWPVPDEHLELMAGLAEDSGAAELAAELREVKGNPEAQFEPTTDHNVYPGGRWR
jgi:hypothetical protein